MLDLPFKTFAEVFCNNQERFAIIRNRLFTLHKTGSSKNLYQATIRRWMLEESETIIDKERSFYEENQDTIEQYIHEQINTKALKKYSDKIADINRVKEMLNSIQEQRQATPINNLIKAVYREYFGIDQIHSQTKIPDMPQNITSDQITKALTHPNDLFRLIVQNHDVLFNPKTCYILRPVSKQTNLQEFVEYNQVRHQLIPLEQNSRIITAYKNLLISRVENIIKTKLPKYEEQFDNLETLDKILTKEYRFLNSSLNSFSNMSVTTTNKNTHVFTLNIKPFININDKKYSFCKGVTCTLDVHIAGDNVTIPNFPRVGLSSFCYGHNQQQEKKDMGYDPTKTYKINSKELPRVISSLFRWVEHKIQYGWGGYTPLANDDEAKEYAKRYKCEDRFFEQYK
jgi:hypothetical protein